MSAYLDIRNLSVVLRGGPRRAANTALVADYRDVLFEYGRSVTFVLGAGSAPANVAGAAAMALATVVDVRPKHWEVQRRLCWFISSLFMDVPRPPPVGRMGSWSVMTPFCAEDILYSARELASKNEDGISVVLVPYRDVRGDARSDGGDAGDEVYDDPEKSEDECSEASARRDAKRP